MATFISHSPAETQALGESWGSTLGSGWVVGLTGDLGAGKTQLVKGLARGLGVPGRVQSPSFALLNEHFGGRLPLFHIDLYRLETREEIIGAGLEPYLFEPKGVTVVEWIERWLQNDPAVMHGTKFRNVIITATSETERQIDYEDFSR